MRKKINIQKGAVLGAILTTIVAGMLLSVVQVVVKPPLLLGERLLPGGGWIQIVLAALFGGMAIFADVRPETTGNVAETYLAALLDRVL